MATKNLNVRISHKYSTYQEWYDANPVLLRGEPSFVVIPAEGGVVNQEPAVLIKVGDGTTAWRDLDFVSAKAADVADWALAATKPTYTADEISGLADYVSGKVNDTNTTYKLEQDTADAHILKLYSKEVGGDWTLAGTITTADTVYDDADLKARITALETGDYLNLADKAELTEAIATAKQEAIDTVLGEGVDADFDTLKEVAAWIQSDTTNSAQLISRVSAIEADYLKVADKSALQTEIDALETLVGTLPEGAVSTTVVAYIQEVVDGLKIGDYAKASELTALAARVTQTENDINALKTRATAIETKLGTVDENAQENVIEIIKVNGVAQTVTDKAVDIAVPAGALAEKDKVSAADLDNALTTTIEGKADTEDLAAVALTGNIADMEQAEGDYLVLNCGTATTVI